MARMAVPQTRPESWTGPEALGLQSGFEAFREHLGQTVRPTTHLVCKGLAAVGLH